MYTIGRIVHTAFVLWFLFVSTAIDALHSHGAFDPDPRQDWQESQLCTVYQLKNRRTPARQLSSVEARWRLDYCPASTYLATLTGNPPESPLQISYAMMLLGNLREENPLALMPPVNNLPPSRGPPRSISIAPGFLSLKTDRVVVLSDLS